MRACEPILGAGTLRVSLYYHLIMAIVRRIVSVVAAIALAVSFAGAGFLACTQPFVTSALANLFSDDATSPFSRSQLVQVADATRDYSFGDHSLGDLYRAIYEIDSQFQQQVESGGGTVSADFPKLGAVTDVDDVQQLAAAFAGASEMYCYSPDTVSHLDDCHDIASIAYPLVVTMATAGLVGLVFTGFMSRKRGAGNVLLAAGIVVLASFIGLGVWAAVDFAGFFATFHGFLFSQGNWTFPYDSLLICALPAAFWMGMGVVWLAVSVLASILSIVIGKKVR